ncbi:MAG: PAS domain S-box protein [Desulfomonile tiedjei]|nr:PAS domain S-box protein [Desulfomonile tiedjei]
MDSTIRRGTNNGQSLRERAFDKDVAKKDAFETAWKDCEARYRQIVEDQTDPVARFWPDGTLTFVNRAYIGFFQTADEELLGASFFDCMTDEHALEVQSRIRSLEPAKPNFRCEHEIAVRPGELRWINWTFQGIFDPEANLVEIQTVARDVTDRKRAEIALKKSEARYSHLINSIPDGVVAYDPQGNATYVNDGFSQLYGWSQEEVLGRSIEFVPPEEKQRTLAAWQKTFEGEQVLLETKRIHKSGKVLEIQLRTAILRDRAGSISESIVIHRDITERKRAQEALQKAYGELELRVEERTAELAQINEKLLSEIAERKHAEERLRESESRYRMLVENAPLGIISCDLQGRIIQVNSNLLTILGSPSPQETKAVNLLTHPPLVEAGISEEVRRCLETGSRVFECSYTSKWGKSAWLRFHMVPTKDNLGRVNGIQAIVEDITDRKHAQDALSESEERFRAVFETAQDLIFLKDRNLVFTHVNPGYLRTLELDESEVIGKTGEEIFGEQEANYIMDLENRVLGGQVVEATYNLSTSGLSKTFHCIRVPMRNRWGETIGICGIARDVTERRALEQPCPRPVARYRSSLMERTLEQVRLAAQSESIVLLLGESGSGKDFLAKYLHDHSRRAGGPFFALNCAALTASIAESELFGHEPGSFTGSRGRKRGLLEMAEGGTLLLNEVGELSQELQAKLLTFLDTQSFTRVGGEKTIQVNARLVGATNRDLEHEVELGRFREDLYYRLNVFVIRVPSLRERKDDIPFLARDLLENLSMKLGRSVPPILDASALDALSRYEWFGNVRELRNVLERALILCRGDVIKSDDISIPKRKADEAGDDKEIPVSVDVSGSGSMNQALETARRTMIVEALKRCDGNVSAAARALGVTRDALRYHMKSLDLERRQPPDGERGRWV